LTESQSEVARFDAFVIVKSNVVCTQYKHYIRRLAMIAEQLTAGLSRY